MSSLCLIWGKLQITNSGLTCELLHKERRHAEDEDGRRRHSFHPTSLPSHPQNVVNSSSLEDSSTTASMASEATTLTLNSHSKGFPEDLAQFLAFLF